MVSQMRVMYAYIILKQRIAHGSIVRPSYSSCAATCYSTYKKATYYAKLRLSYASDFTRLKSSYRTVSGETTFDVSVNRSQIFKISQTKLQVV